MAEQIKINELVTQDISLTDLVIKADGNGNASKNTVEKLLEFAKLNGYFDIEGASAIYQVSSDAEMLAKYNELDGLGEAPIDGSTLIRDDFTPFQYWLWDSTETNKGVYSGRDVLTVATSGTPLKDSTEVFTGNDIYNIDFLNTENYPCFVRNGDGDLNDLITNISPSDTYKGQIYRAFKSLKLTGFKSEFKHTIQTIWNDTYNSTGHNYFRLRISQENIAGSYSVVYDTTALEMPNINLDNNSVQKFEKIIDGKKVSAIIDFSLLPVNEAYELNTLTEQPPIVISDDCFLNSFDYKYSTTKITNTIGYNAWTQGKSFNIGHLLYTVYNRGTSHASSDLKPILLRSIDNGVTYQEMGELNVDVGVNYSTGKTAWSSGVDDTHFYTIVRCRDGVDYSIGGRSKHILLSAPYGDRISESLLPNLTESEITLNNGTDIPILYYSFCLTNDGGICVSYEYLTGEVGVVKSLDKGVTWTKTILMTDEENNEGGVLIYAEPELFYDEIEDKIVGIYRTQSNSPSKLPMFFQLSGDASTVLDSGTMITNLNGTSVQQCPFPLKRVDDKYISVYIERHSHYQGGVEVEGAKIYLLTAKVSDAISDASSAFSVEEIGEIPNQFEDGTVATGVNSLIYSKIMNTLIIHYTAHELDDIRSNIYSTKLFLDKKLNIFNM